MNEASEYVPVRSTPSYQKRLQADIHFREKWGLFLSGAFLVTTVAVLWLVIWTYVNRNVVSLDLQSPDAGMTVMLYILAPLFPTASAYGWLENRKKLKALMH